jgi:TonB family protein
MWKNAFVGACLFGVTAHAQVVALSTPPRWQGGAVPALPALAVGGGQVLVELSIDPSGEVTRVTPLRVTPPFTEPVSSAVRGWRFKPATATVLRDDGLAEAPKSVASRALVAAHFRPPTLITPTLGERPADVGSASSSVPVPVATVEPLYPPKAIASGVVLIEALVDERGSVTEAAVIRSAPPFDAPALEAARQWRFRPATLEGRPAARYVYVIFGFPQPVVDAARR